MNSQKYFSFFMKFNFVSTLWSGIQKQRAVLVWIDFGSGTSHAIDLTLGILPGIHLLETEKHVCGPS